MKKRVKRTKAKSSSTRARTRSKPKRRKAAQATKKSVLPKVKRVAKKAALAAGVAAIDTALSELQPEIKPGERDASHEDILDRLTATFPVKDRNPAPATGRPEVDAFSAPGRNFPSGGIDCTDVARRFVCTCSAVGTVCGLGSTRVLRPRRLRSGPHVHAAIVARGCRSARWIAWSPGVGARHLADCSDWTC